MKKSDRGIEYEKQPNDRCLDIFSEDQLQNDRDFEQDRYGRQKLTQHKPQWMNGDIGRCIWTELAQPAASLVTGEACRSIFQGVPRRCVAPASTIGNYVSQIMSTRHSDTIALEAVSKGVEWLVST